MARSTLLSPIGALGFYHRRVFLPVLTCAFADFSLLSFADFSLLSLLSPKMRSQSLLEIPLNPTRKRSWCSSVFGFGVDFDVWVDVGVGVDVGVVSSAIFVSLPTNGHYDFYKTWKSMPPDQTLPSLIVLRSRYSHGRLEFPQLKRKLIDLAIEHKPNTVLIEEAGPGLHLIQEFRANPAPGVPLPIGIKPEKDKLVRMEAQSARFEAGQVHLPEEAPWLGDFLHEILAFPNSRHDDQIDSVSQFLNWAEAHCKPMSFAPPIIVTRPKGWFDCPPDW